MDITSHRINDEIVCYPIDGRLVAKEVLYNKDSVLDSIPDDANVIIDCSNMDHIDSAGLGMLVSMLQKSKQYDKRVVLVNVPKTSKIVFDITKVTRVFTFAPSMDDAINMLSSHPSQNEQLTNEQ